jgi:hypothetical protein
MKLVAFCIAVLTAKGYVRHHVLAQGASKPAVKEIDEG